jgi:hypothetical protein
MPGLFLKGAIIEFMPTFLTPLPNVIVFQFNPETIRHVWSQREANPDRVRQNPLAVEGLPEESFSFTISLDANDDIATGDPVAITKGIYPRLAALEMLLYPTGAFKQGLLGKVSKALRPGASSKSVPDSQVPTALFVWGPHRIVPVRVTGLSIHETLYDQALNPTHAEADLDLRVLTLDELSHVTGELARVAKVAYIYSQSLRQTDALLNIASGINHSIIGMLPT